MDMKSFVVIPAWNEAPQIQYVVEAARQADPNLFYTDHVLVVDNNSTDHTADLAADAGAVVLHRERQGKGWAMETGVNEVRKHGGRVVTFLDGDLIGLTPEHVISLAKPVLAGEAIMNIGYLGGRKALAKVVLKRWGAFSGQRTISLPDIWAHMQPSDLTMWRAEGAMNAVCRNIGKGALIHRVELDDLKHIGKRNKETNTFRAIQSYSQTYASALFGLMSQSGAEQK